MGPPTRILGAVVCIVASAALLAGCPDSPTDSDADTAVPDVVADAPQDGDVGPTSDADDAVDATADVSADTDGGADADPEIDADGDVSPDVLPDVAPDLPPDLTPDSPIDVPLGAPPTPGDLMISELMVNPLDVSDLSGEWIELANLSGQDLDLSGCTLSDDDGEIAELSAGAGTLSFSGAHYVIARLPNADDTGGVTPDLALPHFTLSNAEDEVIITCGGVELDAVRYSDQVAGAWPLVAGRALSFGAASTQTPDANDDGSLWCPAPDIYSGSNYGSPGAANPVCPDAPEGLDGCRLASPDGESFLEGGNVVLAAEVYEGGVTDKTPFVDPFAALSIEVGWGPAGSDPSVDDTGWIWLTAVAPVGWTNATSDGYDRYQVVLSPPTTGTFAAAARATLSGGAWLFCDVDDIANGFDNLGSFDHVDNPCEPNPCDAPPPATCVDQLVVGYEPLGECTVADGFVAECGYTLSYQDCSEILGTCAVDQCVGAPPQPGPGDMVISEVLIQPLADGDPAGEWFELVNVSGQDLNLAGCVVRDLEGEAHVFAGPLVHVIDGETMVLARSDIDLGGGAAPSYVYGDQLSFDSDADEIQILCGQQTVDSLSWDAAFLNAGDAPIGGPGASIKLAPDKLDATSNDLGVNWCASVETYGGGDQGTPGATNPTCDPVVDVVKCRLQSPASLTIDATMPLTITGRLRQPGLTDISAGNDPSADVLAQGGWGPDGSEPDIDATGWFLVNAIPTVGWDDAGEPGLDEYEVIIPAPPTEGSWDLAFRFSVDGGASWTFCDLDTGLAGEDGSENGYQSGAAGDLTVDVLDPCDPNPCNAPDPDTCTDDALSVYETVGECTADGQTFSCVYPATVIDCAALGGSCVIDTCTGVAVQPLPGDVIVSEIMVGDGAEDGQWIELLNVSGGPVNLAGCDFGTGLGSLSVSDDQVMFAADRVLLAYASVPGGPAADLEWAGSGLGALTLGSAVTLACGATIIDVVDLASGGFEPPALGRSMILDETLATAADNDSAASWCAAATSLGSGLMGSPGVANAACPVEAPVTQCRLQAPDIYVGFANDSVILSGRVRIDGLTDLTPGIDPGPDLLAEAGFAPQGDLPAAGTWTFDVATADGSWDATGTGDETYDAYELTVAPASGGTFDAAFRFSADRGRTWTMCDLDTGVPGADGSEDGYASADAGTIALFDPCEPNPCTGSPANSCSGDVLTSYPDPGLCDHSGGVAVCDYPPQTTDCAALGGICSVDQCQLPPDIAPGELVISELMPAVAASGNEWIELFNTTGEVRNLAGCTLDVDGATLDVTANTIVPPGAYVIASAQASGDFASLLVYGADLSMADDGSTVSLVCGSPAQLIDAVTFSTGAPWPVVVEGRSLQLDAASSDATSNDSGDQWCTGVDGYGSDGEFGTPGSINNACQ